MSDESERLIQQALLELYESDAPLSVSEIATRTNTRSRQEAKSVLRKMIGRGLISSTPDWRFRLGTRARRSLQDTETVQEGGLDE